MEQCYINIDHDENVHQVTINLSVPFSNTNYICLLGQKYSRDYQANMTIADVTVSTITIRVSAYMYILLRGY